MTTNQANDVAKALVQIKNFTVSQLILNHLKQSSKSTHAAYLRL